LLGGPPDQLLGDAAAAGKLGSPAERASQAGRLFDQAGFNDVARRFHALWLGLDGLAGRGGNGLTQAQVDSMRLETMKFIDYVFKEGAHKVSALLTVPIGFVDANLAPIYGLPDSNGQLTQFSPVQRAGVLTLASTLARYNNPTQRGCLCGIVSYVSRCRRRRTASTCASRSTPAKRGAMHGKKP